MKPNMTPAEVFDLLVNGNYETVFSNGFEYGFDLDATGVYAENIETGDYFLCTGEYDAPITNETEWLDSPV
jgi:hypothetical protein